ncbi:MAG TPA: PEGA domain-containing protein [Planctomycetota bacterium]|nr:PEGA domain-containing protein [Planctomycetota bacterium]
MSRAIRFVGGVLAAASLVGCVERFIAVRTDPPGAMVTLDDQKIGPTPVDIPYTWYGMRLLSVDLAGYREVREIIALNPPWWQFSPLDFITDVVLPVTITDRTEFSYPLEKATAKPDRELEEVRKRAAELREKAEAPR